MHTLQNNQHVPAPFIPSTRRRVRSSEPAESPAAAARHAAPAVPSANPATLLQLMHAQTQLMQQLVNTQTQQHIEHRIDCTEFRDPHKLLSTFDPGMKQVLTDWLREFKKKLSTHVTQQELSRKYEKIQNDGEVPRQLHDDMKETWQWPKFYLATAKPLSDAHEDINPDAMHDYSIKKAWQSLRERQARECQDFIFAHQKECANQAQQTECSTRDRRHHDSLVAKVRFV